MLAKEITYKYDNMVIKLGFGTGFVFCGKVDENLPKLLKRADAYYIDRAERSKETTLGRIERYKVEIKKLPGIIADYENALEVEKAELEELKNRLDEEDAEIEKLKKLLETEEGKVNRKAIKASIKDIKGRITTYKASIDEVNERIKDLEGDSKHEGTINMKKRHLEYLKQLVPKLKRSVKAIDSYIETYKPFCEREVREEYHSIDHFDTLPIDMIVVCEGKEDGRYWTCKEYEKDKERPY